MKPVAALTNSKTSYGRGETAIKVISKLSVHAIRPRHVGWIVGQISESGTKYQFEIDDSAVRQRKEEGRIGHDKRRRGTVGDIPTAISLVAYYDGLERTPEW